MSFVTRIPEKEGSMTAILAPYPEIAKSVSMMMEYVMRSDDSQFSLAERELIATFVSDVNYCTYAARTHQAAAVALGVDEAVFAALLVDIDSAPLSENLKPVLKYVKKLTLTPTQITQKDADAIFGAGWNEKSFHFATMICGLFSLFNRLLDGYGIKSSEAHCIKAGRALAESGYRHVAEIAEED